jgi:hypothetical protein
MRRIRDSMLELVVQLQLVLLFGDAVAETVEVVAFWGFFAKSFSVVVGDEG